jgi:hypothetical protein
MNKDICWYESYSLYLEVKLPKMNDYISKLNTNKDDTNVVENKINKALLIMLSFIRSINYLRLPNLGIAKVYFNGSSNVNV